MKTFTQKCKGCKGLLTFKGSDHGKSGKCDHCGTVNKISYPPKAAVENKLAKEAVRSKKSRERMEKKKAAQEEAAETARKKAETNARQKSDILKMKLKAKESKVQPPAIKQTKALNKPRPATLSDFLIQVAEWTILLLFILLLVPVLIAGVVIGANGEVVRGLLIIAGYIGLFAGFFAPVLALFRISYHVRQIN